MNLDQIQKERVAVNYQRARPYPTLEDVADLNTLLLAWKATAKHRRYRHKIYEIDLSLGTFLLDLQEDLLNGTYKPQLPHVFEKWCQSGQKTRIISSMHDRDALVQHAIYLVTYNIFDQGFIFDSYGCRIGKGSHRASDRLRSFIKRSDQNSYYLQLDVRKFYYNIRHQELRESIERKIHDPRLVDLMMLMVKPDDDVGLCVGGMISQMYGLIYLDRLDHFIKRTLRVKNYIRYVDDIIIIGITKDEAHYLKGVIGNYIAENLGLEFSKFKINTVKSGINFVGFRHWPNRVLVRKRSMKNFNRALKANRIESVQSCLAHAMRTNTFDFQVRNILETWSHTQIRKMARPFKLKILAFAKELKTNGNI